MEAVAEQFSQDLGLELESLGLIKENAYCTIYRAVADRRPVILKKYKGDDARLVQEEAKSLDFYHELVRDDPNFIDSGTVKLNAEKNLVCIAFVEGECFSDLVYRGRRDPEARERSARIMAILGDFLKRLYEMTCSPGTETAPFIFEYLEYCSRQLEGIPLLGSLLFGGYRTNAAALSEAFRAAEVAPSFIHGDFVFRNIHVDGERVGLIDFANTNSKSHVLNDVYNLRLALDNMILPQPFNESLWSAFCAGLGAYSFPEIAHRFYYEYHRRRWLMLKIKSRHPRDWFQALRGLTRFAKPFAPMMNDEQ